MAWISLALSAACAALAAYVALGQPDRAGTPGAQRIVLLVLRPLARATAGLASHALVDQLLRREALGRLADALLAYARERGDKEGTLRVRTREEACAILVMGWACAVALSVPLLAMPVASVGVALSPVVAIPLWDAARARRRSQELAAEMPGVFRTLAMAMGAGETLAQAIEYVGTHESGPAGQAFLRASMRLRCGVAAEESLGILAEELDAPGVSLLVTALLISQRTGSPLRELFQGSATLVERQGEFERMLSVKTAQVRLSVRVVSLLPLVLVCGLSLISPDFQRGLTTIPGMVSLGVAAGMDGVALLVIRSLMRGVV